MNESNRAIANLSRTFRNKSMTYTIAKKAQKQKGGIQTVTNSTLMSETKSTSLEKAFLLKAKESEQRVQSNPVRDGGDLVHVEVIANASADSAALEPRRINVSYRHQIGGQQLSNVSKTLRRYHHPRIEE